MNDVEKYLTEQKIAFESVEFPWRMADETARLEAEKLAIPTENIFKTLVLKGNKTGPVIAVVPLDARLDYKKCAKATGNHKIGLPPMDYVLETTGYPHGANTPIGIHLSHPEYLLVFDQSVDQLPEILVSSGEIGRSVKLASKDLLALLEPIVADVLKEG